MDYQIEPGGLPLGTDDDVLKGISDATADSEIALLEAQLIELDGAITEAEVSAGTNVEMLQEAESEIERIRKEATERINAIRFKIQADREKQFDERRRLKDLAANRDSIKRQIEQAERSKLAAAQFKMLEDKWQVLFNSWYDGETPAMPHQGEAAKRIANSSRLILADTMGLGKTRSVLMAIDLIESMTEEASPEHPIEIGV